MQTTYRVSLARAGLLALTATALLLAHPGTSIAAGASESLRAATDNGLVLERGAGYAAVDRRKSVRALQSTLRELGWQPGPVDGLFGPRTEAAVTRFQTAAGLAVDGAVGPQTVRAMSALAGHRLARGAGYAADEGSQRVRRLQRALKRQGLRPGPIDGRFGPLTQQAVVRLQRAAQLPTHGVVDRRTGQLLAEPVVQEASAERPDASRLDRPKPTPVRELAGPRDPVAVADTAGGAIGLVALAAGVALLLGALGGVVIGRRRTAGPGIAVPVLGGVIAEGDGPSVGHFRGEIKALAVSRPRFMRAPETHYLVTVPNIGAFWVSDAEIASMEESMRVRDGDGERDPTERPLPVKQAARDVRALGYTSTPLKPPDETDRLRVQANDIDAYCEERRWQLLEIVNDLDDGHGSGHNRPGLAYALDRIARGEAACLVVAEMERLGLALPDLARMIAGLHRSGGRLVIVDLGLDTGSRDGELAAETLVSIGSRERIAIPGGEYRMR
jgi:peptidoglycan hydrolase-like protein with peptidoglycan-binding domain